MDLTNLGQPLLQGGLLDTVSRFIGGNRDSTQKAFQAALPTSMYALADHGSSEVGARSLIDGLRNGQAPELDVKDLGRTLGDPQAADQLLTRSGGFLERMTGGKLDGILGALSSFGGLDRGGSSKILALVTPLALGLIGKRVRSDNLDARGLAGFLSDQKSKVATQVPGPLRSFLGLGAPAAAAGTIPWQGESTRREAIRPVEGRRVIEPERKRSIWPWLLGALAALLGLGWLAMRGRPKAPEVTPTTMPAPELKRPTEVQPPRAPEVTPPQQLAQPQAPQLAEPQAPQVAEPAPEANAPQLGATAPSAQNPALAKLSSFLNSGEKGPGRFALDGMNFSTDGTRLSADGQKVAEDLAALLKAHPNAKVRIEGHTDSVGNAAGNQQLSQSRADTLKRYLTNNGVAPDRIQTAGMGAQNPTSSNDTAEGRAQNRRIEVVVEN